MMYGKSCSSEGCAEVVRRGCAGGLCGGLCGVVRGLCGQACAASCLLFEGAQEPAFYEVNQLLPARLVL